MLALGVDYGKPGGGRGGGRGRGRGRTLAAWQSPIKERPLARDGGVSIKQKISQWEGLSQSEDGHGGKARAHGTPVSRTFSGDVLENRVSCDDKCDRPHNKASLSKTVSLGLDFRENQVSHGQFIGRKSDPRLDRAARLNRVITSTPVSKPSLASTQIQPPANRLKNNYGDGGDNLTDTAITSLPPYVEAQCAEDLEDSLPPGNFYTSRGFWRKLEGEDSFWDKERDSSPLSRRLFSWEAATSPPDLNVPPPKPQRTFQYRGAESPPAHLGQCERQTSPASQLKQGTRRDVIRPPSGPPPPCPVSPRNGFSRNRRNRKSFEFEDVVRLVSPQVSGGTEAGRSGLSHARSQDSIYEDIIPDIPRENPYEDIKLSPMCLPLIRSRNWTVTQRPSPQAPKLPPKPLTLRANADRLHDTPRDFKHSATSSFQTSKLSTPKPYRTQRLPQYVSRIQEIFQAKRGRKRVKSQTSTSRDDLSGTESDPEDNIKGDSQRLVYVQSTLKRRPGYRTLERDLIQLQQEQLFQLFVVVSLRKRSPGNTYYPEVTQQFPTKFEKSSRLSREAEDRLKAIPSFCFPDAQDWKPSADANRLHTSIT